MYVKVKVFTNAKKESVEKIGENRFETRVKPKAERNMANRRVLEIIAEYFKIPVSKIRIINGHQSPSKMLSVDVD